ncbi:uncharacterized protein MONOS_4921 [Monocercomonoides exilis]|uniref:uncharacterized protein n=1 Tax=Monocercomonoides exilis TaxID=2049356 RepID=UPI0035595B22|nr:hypothetical protein MONOS_4921 [Monocercomonoides exilis]|eukprot:MONOS_4921.1-p1 / transcript=MONOS_4921.1 / gene=MONOS_4921 / organism=Monocercomonoides_exilis_PA203 / gene_product=unspecified product / transcript_product=unspecified product / location=Mono_scaffold00137:110039-110675(+) / protein_length=193 / sequence_SO=supercontig / SO=protein_coding / is_pseudo=false
MSLNDKIATARALYFQDDKEYRLLIVEQQKLADLIENDDTDEKTLEEAAELFYTSCMRMRIILHQAQLVRQAKIVDEKCLAERIRLIEAETKTRAEALALLDLELEQAKKDADKVVSLQPSIQEALSLPSRPQLDKEMEEAQMDLSEMINLKHQNDTFVEQWRQRANALFSALDKMDEEGTIEAPSAKNKKK